MKVDFIDLKRQYIDISDEMGETVADLVANARFVGGEPLENFQRDFAKYHGAKHCIGVGSGSDALFLSLLALGIGPGDEVIVPANTFIATIFAVSHTGATPIFVDVCPNTYNICAAEIPMAITDRTRAIMPVHLYGQSCNMTMIMDIAKEHNLKVVEDCAQSTGAKWEGKNTGTFGECGCFSFYPTKNLGGLGQGGAILTDDQDIADKIDSFGNVGRTKDMRYKHNYIGFNSRLDTINAAFLSKGLLKLDERNSMRNKVAQLYNEFLTGVGGVFIPVVVPGATHVYHLYVIGCVDKDAREELKNHLASKNIFTGVYYPIPCHQQLPYSMKEGSFVITEQLSKTLLALPMHPYLTEEEIVYVCDSIYEKRGG